MNRTNTLRHLRHPAAGILAVLVAGAVGSVATSCGRASAEVSQTEALPADHADPSSIRELVYALDERYAEVHDYRATFYKRERVRGRMLEREKILMKFRKPFSVYFLWLDGKREGQESIYVQGWNNDKIRAHPGSFPDITVNLKPRSSLAMRDNRHPVTEAGIGNVIKLITRDVRRGEARPQDGVRFVDHGYETVHGAKSRCVEAIMPADAESGYYAHRAKICVDQRTELPNRVLIWDHTNTLVEDYAFAGIQVNVGLTDADFDPDNPTYGF